MPLDSHRRNDPFLRRLPSRVGWQGSSDGRSKTLVSFPNAQVSTSKTASVWVRIPLMPDEGMVVQLAETAGKSLSCNFVGTIWGHRPRGGRQNGILEIRVRFPMAPPMSRSSKKTGIPEDTALSGGDEGVNPSLLSPSAGSNPVRSTMGDRLTPGLRANMSG